MLGFIFNRRKLLKDIKLLGKWGERQCEKFLKQKGLKTLTRNYACNAGEIDLIMVAPDHAIVFVEVKTRADEDFTPTETVVNKTKIDKMTKTARYFLSVNEIQNRPYRFDIVTVTLGQRGPAEIRHYKNAFLR
ncbi:MAG: YraN family protein [Sedimentisphaerales bacterium]|nr:YraN family protein [Sedimentisphaerales bacterium]